MKRIAVQEGLEKIKEALTDKGYEVVGYDDKGHIDAIVYRNIDQGMQSVNNSDDGNVQGAILINIANKTLEEIEYIIETRRYGSLF